MRRALLLEPNPEQELVAEFQLAQKLVLDVETDLFHLGIDLELGLHLQMRLGPELDLRTVLVLVTASNLQMVLVLVMASHLQMVFALELAPHLQMWLVLETVRVLQIVLDWKQVLHLQMEIELDLPAYPVSLMFLDLQTDQKPVGFPPDWPVDHLLSRTLLTILLVSLLSPSNLYLFYYKGNSWEMQIRLK